MIEKSIFFLCIIYSLTTQAQRDGQHVFPTIEADSVVLYILNQHLTHYPKSVPYTLFDSNGLRTDLRYSKRFSMNKDKDTNLPTYLLKTKVDIIVHLITREFVTGIKCFDPL